MRQNHFSKSSYGFTLIELLVVVSIIALLVSILLPALAKARDSARNVMCMVNLRSCGQGFYYYQDSHEEAMKHIQTEHPYEYRPTKPEYYISIYWVFHPDSIDVPYKQVH